MSAATSPARCEAACEPAPTAAAARDGGSDGASAGARVGDRDGARDARDARDDDRPRRRRPTPVLALTCVTPPTLDEVRGRAALAVLGPAPPDVAVRVLMLGAGTALMVTALAGVALGVVAGAAAGGSWTLVRRGLRTRRQARAEDALQTWLDGRPFPIVGLRGWLNATRPVIDVTLSRPLPSSDLMVGAAHGHDPLMRVMVRRSTEVRFALPQRWVITGRGRATPVPDAEALWVFVERVLGPLHEAAGVAEVILRDGTRSGSRKRHDALR